MKSVNLIPVLILTGLTGCYSPPEISPMAAPEGDYVLDPAHASVIWSVKHAGLSNYTARFDEISGALTFDPENPENSRVDIIIDPNSVSTGDPDFDAEIASKSGYFDGDTYPQIRFVSTDIVKTGENTGKITGDLTFRGTTLPVTLDTVFNGAGKSFGHPGKTLGFSATAQIKRSDFGMTNLINFGIGDEVSLVIETEFNEK
ncbi:MAG: polyisoprenoid-binding protein [Hyphomonadaceae bacterium]|nr:polyisoprenoid-binding protein [Hyphomonadaceae bacterium]